MPQNPTLFAPPPEAEDGADLTGMDRDGFAALVAGMGLPRFRAEQLWHWVYHRGATDFAEMTTLAKGLRGDFGARFRIGRPEISRQMVSTDGTQKWLLRLASGHEVETVFIPEKVRGTLCVSSQVGCTLACRFCHTGTQKLVRNLSAAEIVGQVMVARDALGEWPASSENRQLTNIVMMGMGEPLYNYDNVAAALKIMMDGEGIAISRRRITLSTAGVVPMMDRVGDELGVKLAVSLHAPTDAVRDQIVPLNKKYPLKDLIAACRRYPGVKNSRRITFEYVMLDGINDSPADARALVKLIAGIPAKLNLIPFNAWPGAPYQRSSEAAIERFADIVRAAGYPTPVRRPRGEDILAACGQLKSASERIRASARVAAE